MGIVGVLLAKITLLYDCHNFNCLLDDERFSFSSVLLRCIWVCVCVCVLGHR